MTAYTLLLAQPEIPVSERWIWITNLLTADDGTEQRISLSSVPKRTWSLAFAFDRSKDINRFNATMFAKSDTHFSIPLWSEVVRLKAKASAAATNIYVNTARGDFRVGQTVLLIEDDTFETAVVNTVSSDHINLTAGITNTYTTRALLVPVIDGYVSAHSWHRDPNNDTGRATATVIEYSFLDPFIQVADTVALTTFNSLPVLDKRQTGTDFEGKILDGSEVTEYGGVPSIRSRWINSKFAFPISFNWDRVLDPADYFWWKSFGDYCRGGTNPFYVPMWRDDLRVHTAAAVAGTTVTLEGTEYSDHYYDTFKHIFFHADSGATHYATVTGKALSGGNDVLTFTPALPSGDWTGQELGFLLSCAINDDTIALEHYGPSSVVTLNVRTVPE